MHAVCGLDHLPGNALSLTTKHTFLLPFPSSTRKSEEGAWTKHARIDCANSPVRQDTTIALLRRFITNMVVII